MMDAGRHPGIEILICSEVIALEGEAGALRATVRCDPTGVNPERCTGCGDCATACPVTAPNPFDVGLGTRKAIFRPFPQAVPATYAIDPALCLNDGALIACERCRQACPADAIDLELAPREVVRAVGAVIVATGFDEFDPRGLRNYGYGVYPNVLTSLELERLLNASGPTLGHVVRPSDQRPPREVIYVQCVGSRGEAGNAYCSRYCCMNAVKDALLLKQHDPEVTRVTVLYIDIRAFGKGFEEFTARAAREPWVRLLRGRPAKILEDPHSHNLEVFVEDTERGRPQRLTAEMVVLSCAGRPASGTAELAARLGIEVAPSGFLTAGSGTSAVSTSHPAVFVCGSVGGPQVIPDCVAQASAAAAEAAICARRAPRKEDAGETPAPAPESPAPAVQPTPAASAATAAGADGTPEVWAAEMSSVAEEFAAGSWSVRLGEHPPAPLGPPPPPAELTAEAAGDAAGAPDGVELAEEGAVRVGLFLCHCGINIAGVLGMEELATYARRLPGVVHVSEELFACSSSSQAAIQEAITEHQLNRIVVAACTPRTHEPVFRQNCQEAGLNPYLVEMVNIRDQCSWVHTQEPQAATAKARDLLRMATARARRLRPLQPTQVSLTRRVLVVGGGLPGMKAASDLAALGFEVTLIEQEASLGGLVRELHTLYPERHDARRAVAALEERLAASPVDVRRATSLREATGFVGNFQATLGPAAGGGDGDGEALAVGAILLAIGARPYTPARGEFGFGELPQVITSVDLEARLAAGEHGLAGVRRVAFIQCVGSRSAATDPPSSPGAASTTEPASGSAPASAPEAPRGGYPGCSRTCCPTTVKQALALGAAGIETVVFYRDMRMVGRGAEELYREARQRGTVFVRYAGSDPPRVTGGPDGPATVAADDTLLGTEVRAPADLVVLAVGLVPRAAETQALHGMLKTPLGTDGFFLERHPELGPIETCVDGVFLCGTAQGPKDLHDALAQASAAASKCASLLGRDHLLLDPTVCTVDPERCRGCGLCVSICEFHGPQLELAADGTQRAVINPALCKGCGTCAVWCPTGAIQAQHFTDDQITAMIDSLFAVQVR